ncbi:MAG: hypothetical protein MMC23_004869 [Stictis urceolatum]|nr:hypothetical protein [Stictis urceolata]
MKQENILAIVICILLALIVLLTIFLGVRYQALKLAKQAEHQKSQEKGKGKTAEDSEWYTPGALTQAPQPTMSGAA